MSAGVAEFRRRLAETSDGGRKLRALAELLSPYRWRVSLMCLSLLLATVAALAPAPLAKEAINKGIDQHDTTALYAIAGIFLISAVVYAVATWAQTYLVGWVGQRALQDLRMKLFAHLQSLSVGFYSRNIAGVVISRMTNDVEALVAPGCRCAGPLVSRGVGPGGGGPGQNPGRRWRLGIRRGFDSLGEPKPVCNGAAAHARGF